MNVIRGAATVTAMIAGMALAAGAQQGATPEVARVITEPATVTLEAGKTLRWKVTALDKDGKAMPKAFIRFAAPRGSLSVTDTSITARAAGSYEVTIIAMSEPRQGITPVQHKVAVKVTWPPIHRVDVAKENGRLYQGATMAHSAKALHADGSARTGVTTRWSSSDPAIATVDRFGNVTALKPGSVSIVAQIDDGRGELRHVIVPNPVTAVDVEVSSGDVRTGDVVKVNAIPKDRNGQLVKDAPITWSFTYAQDDSIRGQGGAADLRDGQFAADYAGQFSLIASSGQVSGRKTIDVRPRDVVQRIVTQGQGAIRHVHTSDLWTFTGVDGREYALVGTWGGDGWAYMFDITDPSTLVKTDSVQVDARTINDVTVAPHARWAALSREGASNRVNGVVILDLAVPAHPKIVSRFDQELTGGVHNMFATTDYLYAISGGDKYVIIDMKDFTNPKFAGEYNHPDSYVHDVWVNDGIAYSSEWGTGVVVVDVGNGTYGGTPQKPKLISTYGTTSGSTHEVYPYFQKSTGRTYIFLGDEIMSRRGRAWEGTNYDLMKKGGVPQTMAGYTHIVDFTDPKNPKNVARYEQPEFGSHDIIVENDILYQAYYEGGVRVVDVSGDLMGNLARQQREIAVWKPFDPQGYTPNAPMVMNAMPHKGVVYFTDFNSGLYSAKLQPKPKIVP
ncbi:MAG: Ig-like domain-containing protein [Gemmatimonadaceae bacterium]